MRNCHVNDEAGASLRLLGMLSIFAIFGSLSSAPLGCGAEEVESQIVVVSVGPSPILPLTQLVIAAEGRPDLLSGVVGFEFRGEIEGKPFERTGTLRIYWTRISESNAGVASWTWMAESPIDWDARGKAQQRFVGRLRLLDRDGQVLGDEESELLFRRVLEPRFEHALEAEAYWGEAIELVIANGLLRLEGKTEVELEGLFRRGDGRDAPVHGLRLGCKMPEEVASLDQVPGLAASGDRERCRIAVGPSTFPGGVGWFRGEVWIVNVHADGTVLRSERRRGTIIVLPPEVSFSEQVVSRGRWIEVAGRGLWMGPPGEVLTRPEKWRASYTRLRLEGLFKPKRGAVQSFEGVNAILLAPEVGSSGRKMRSVLRPEFDSVSGLDGLGSTPGRFEGRVSAVTKRDDGEMVVAEGRRVEFEVATPTQVVVLRFLPEFQDALERFGLEVMREAVIARVFEVVRRDFQDFAVSVVMEVPEAFADFMVVEIGGEDPNGLGLLGLDSTPDKDVGNAHLDEVIGARTDASEGGLDGGIFVSEFMRFSPRIGEGVLVSERFDDVFEAFSPELGGRPVELGEARGGAPRTGLIAQAVRVLGNLIGATATHELGHALGLTAIAQRVHNEGDNPLAIMDEGGARPFEERAELDGRGPAVWEPYNRLYLESILPLTE